MSEESKHTAMSKADIKILETIYLCTDCSNSVFDWGMLHHMQECRAYRLAKAGLVEFKHGIEKCDGDGFTTHRTGTGFRLTLAGYEALTAHSPEGYPVELRREWAALATADAAGRKGEE